MGQLPSKPYSLEFMLSTLCDPLLPYIKSNLSTGTNEFIYKYDCGSFFVLQEPARCSARV